MGAVTGVPLQFGLSYTVPLLKGSACSLVTAKTWLLTILEESLSVLYCPRYLSIVYCYDLRPFLKLQTISLGSRKEIGCQHASYTVRLVVNYYVFNCSTVNIQI